MHPTLEEKIAVLDERTKNFEKTAIEIKLMISEFIRKSETQTENMPKKYAGKWVETVSLGVLVSVIAGLLMFVFSNVKAVQANPEIDAPLYLKERNLK